MRSVHGGIAKTSHGNGCYQLLQCGIHTVDTMIYALGQAYLEIGGVHAAMQQEGLSPEFTFNELSMNGSNWTYRFAGQHS